MPLHEDAQEAFAIVSQGGFFTPTRVPQGVQNATRHFQATIDHDVLAGVIGEDYIIKGWTPRELLLNVVKVV